MNVCVFCGSSPGRNSEFQVAGRELGRALAAQELGLVYGGASIGVMGAVADSVLKHNGFVHGVIPEHLMREEVAHSGLSKLTVTQSMHERKALMASESAAFITLPGGFGTFEELLEIITWAQLEIHRKPIYILNISGYYDQLLAFFGQAVSAGFIREKNMALFEVFESVAECEKALASLNSKPEETEFESEKI